MNATTQPALPAVGTPMPGGFFAGAIIANGQRRAIISAPKKLAELRGVWHPDYVEIPAGTRSYFDGMANTLAMAEAGSPIAKQALALEIDNLKDFYIPSQDELDIIYRAFKPTTDSNSQYSRSGLNVSAVPPTYPYTPESPAQTLLEAFKAGGTEAFEAEFYWSSTPHAGNRHCA